MEVDTADDGPSRAEASTSGSKTEQEQQGQDSKHSQVKSTCGTVSKSAIWPLLFPVELEGLAKSHLNGTDDLITALGLRRTYNRAVGQYLNLPGGPSASGNAATDIKGKGRALDKDGAPSPLAVKTEDAAAALAREKAKSMKKHYSHMIVDVPGQNKLAKDHHLRDLLMNPEPPDRLDILTLDDTALREAFTLEVGMLPDFDATIWRADADDQVKKKKKKRKQEDSSGAGAAENQGNGAPSPMATGPGSGVNNAKKRRLEQL